MNLRKILKIVGIVFLVLVVAVAALPFIFKNKIVQWAKNEVNKELNAKVDFTSASLSIFRSFPDLTLGLDSLTIEGVDDFEGERLAYVERLNLTLDIMTVIKGDVVKIKTIGAEKPDIRLIISKDGKSNWDIFKEAEEEELTSDEGYDLAVLQYYEISDGTLSFEHFGQNVFIDLEGVTHSGKGDFGSQSFLLSTHSEAKAASLLYEGVTYLNKVSLSGSADFMIEFDPFTISFVENEWKMNELYITFDGSIAMPNEDIVFDLKFQPTRTDFKTILSFVPAIYKRDFAKVQTEGKVTFEGYLKGLYSDNPASMPGFGLQLQVNQGLLRYPDLPKTIERINFDLSLKSEGKQDYDDMIIHLKQGDMVIAGNPISGSFLLKTPFSDPDIDLSVMGKLNLDDIADIIPVEEGEAYKGLVSADIQLKGRLSSLEQKRYRDFNANGYLTLDQFDYKTSEIPYNISADSVRFTFTPQALILNHADLLLGKSDVSLQGRIDNYLEYFLTDDILQGAFQAKSRTFNLNELMSALPDDSAEAEADSIYAIALPKNVDIELQASIDRLIYDNLDIRNSSGKVAIRDQTAFFDKMKMSLLGGEVLLDGTYNVKDINNPQVIFNFDIVNMDINQVATHFNTVSVLAPLATRTTGKFSTGMTFNSLLDHNLRPNLSTILSKGRISANDIFIEGFEPLNELASRLNISRLAKQRIEDLKLIFRIEEGRIIVDPYDVAMGDIKATVSGFTTLDQQMSYDVQLAIPRSEFGTKANTVLNNFLKELENKGLNVALQDNLKVDVKFEGNIRAPRVTLKLPDDLKNIGQSISGQVQQLAEDKAKEILKELDKKKEEVKEDIEEKIEDTKAKAQEELNRRADQVIVEAERQAARLREEAKRAADAIRKESEEQAAKLESEASNPLRQAAAKVAADKIRREGQRSASRVEQEAEERSASILLEAKNQADRIRSGE